MRRRLRFAAPLAFAALAAAFLASPTPAAAQCMPDLLDSQPCCLPVAANLPVFPAISQSSKFLCFRDCATQLNANLCVTIDPPAMAGGGICGVYTIKFKVRQCGGTMPILWQGNLRAQYSRNWLEAAPTGTNYGVWRFLLNGDLKATATLQANPSWANPNVRPGCYGNFNAIYVAGYIDYAYDCNLNTWTAAWAVNHDCDANHHPVGSPRAGAFHPTRSWTFLGPGAGFVPNTTTTLTGAGAVGGEALRWNDWSTAPAICRGEEPVNGLVQSLGSFCPCSTNPGAPGQYENSIVSVQGSCGSFSRTIVPPIVPFLQKRIGQWTNPNVFPGLEYLNIDMGDMDYNNACTLLFSTEFFEGVTTLGGYPATSYSAVPLGRQQMDLGSANRSPSNPARRVGVPHITNYVINFDMP